MKYTTVFPNDNLQYIRRVLYNNLIYNLKKMRNFVNIRELPGKWHLCRYYRCIMGAYRRIFSTVYLAKPINKEITY